MATVTTLTLNTRFGIETFESDYTLKELRDKLEEVKGAFAQSLVKNFDDRPDFPWSAKQELWARFLVSKSEETPKESVDLGNFSRILSLFEVGSSKLKSPKIRFELVERLVVLYRAGKRSKYNGQIQVTDGGDWGDNVWYGRIDLDGVFHPSRAAHDGLISFLKEFAENPSALAAKYGKIFGKCCFCNRTLTTTESKTVGYGPVCAEHYGLPWGR